MVYKTGLKNYNEAMDETAKVLIVEALKKAFGNQSIAAKLLGINRNTLRAKVEKLKIDVREYKI
ncbi:MAG: hypothetical protein HQL29_05210 [Candidatus Omnitrophica bacterium]|nr:hypothetical protein [Candidatus Omnitrophota bacterium]